MALLTSSSQHLLFCSREHFCKKFTLCAVVGEGRMRNSPVKRLCPDLFIEAGRQQMFQFSRHSSLNNKKTLNIKSVMNNRNEQNEQQSHPRTGLSCATGLGAGVLLLVSASARNNDTKTLAKVLLSLPSWRMRHLKMRLFTLVFSLCPIGWASESEPTFLGVVSLSLVSSEAIAWKKSTKKNAQECNLPTGAMDGVERCWSNFLRKTDKPGQKITNSSEFPSRHSVSLSAPILPTAKRCVQNWKNHKCVACAVSAMFWWRKLCSRFFSKFSLWWEG